MKEPRISILIPAHNEEKVIGTALDAIQKIIRIEYRNIEVIVGLDGCTDRTEEIARRYKFVKVFKSKERLGKPEMLFSLLTMAKGEIIILHDADWYLVSNNNFINIIKYFKDPKVGGLEDVRIATTQRMPILNLGESFLTQLIREFKIQRYTYKKDGNTYAKIQSPYPFMVNIFRKSALPERQYTLCDDGERSIQLLRKDYKVIIPMDIPYFAIHYSSKITIGDLYKQKLRGFLARKQIQEQYNEYKSGFTSFYIPAFIYCLRRVSAIAIGVVLYWFVSFFALIASTGKRTTTKEGWKMRLKR